MAEEARHTVPPNAPTGESPPDNEKEDGQSEKAMDLSARHRVVSFLKTLLFTILVAFMLKLFVVEAFRIPSGSMENTLLIGDYLLVNKLAYGIRTPRYVPFTNLSIPSMTMPVSGNVRRGDVVVFEFPGRRKEEAPSGPEYYIKRCIGLPGDTIDIRSGYVRVNGREVLLPSHAKTSMIAETLPTDPAQSGPSTRSSIDRNNYGPTVVPKKGDVIRLTLSNMASWKQVIEREHHDLGTSSAGSITIDGVEASDYIVTQNYYFMLGDNRGNSLDSRFWGFVPDDHIIGEALLLYWSWDPEQPGEGAHSPSASIRWDRIGTLIR